MKTQNSSQIVTACGSQGGTCYACG